MPALNTRLVWFLMAALIVADAIGMHAEGMSIVTGRTFLFTIVLTVGLMALSFGYTALRRDARIAALAHMASATLAFTASAAVFSYLTVTWQRPLIDHWLVAADHALGLDWPAAYQWVVRHHPVHIVLAVAYFSLTSQMILLLVSLNFLGRISRCWEMQWMFMLATCGCLFFSALWPAAGAFVYFRSNESEPYVQAFLSLREGTLKVIDQDAMQGVIQFPSLHVALGMIYTYSARGIRYLFPFLVVTNTLLFLGTPALGGHHFADLWGGVGLTLVTILAVRKMSAAGLLPQADGTSPASPERDRIDAVGKA